MRTPRTTRQEGSRVERIAEIDSSLIAKREGTDTAENDHKEGKRKDEEEKRGEGGSLRCVSDNRDVKSTHHSLHATGVALEDACSGV